MVHSYRERFSQVIDFQVLPCKDSSILKFVLLFVRKEVQKTS